MIDRPVTTEEIEANLQEALQFCETLIGVEIPRTINDALTLEWLERAAAIAEWGVERVSKKELAAARQRVVSLPRANAILRSIENRAIHLFVQEPGSECVRALMEPFAWIGYFVQNEGEILILLSELAGHVAHAIEQSEFLEASIQQWEIRDRHLRNFDFGNFWRQLASQHEINERLIIAIIESTSETIERALTQIAWDQIGPIVGAFSSAAVAIKTMKPLIESQAEALKSAKKSPLPQRSHGRVRRRKSSRK